MKVKELVEKLSTFDQDASVVVARQSKRNNKYCRMLGDVEGTGNCNGTLMIIFDEW